MKTHTVKLGLVVLVVALQAIFNFGCASGMTRTTGNKLAPYKVSTEAPIATIGVSLTPEVRDKLKDSFKFNQDTFLKTMEQALSNNRLFDKTKQPAGLQMSILVTHVRVRSTFNAVMWGAMSGNDSIHGDVVLKDASGATLDSFKVTASYALGGFAGGQDDARMNWLYEAFAKEVVHALNGDS